MVEKWIHWILHIYDRFKLNFDGSRIKEVLKDESLLRLETSVSTDISVDIFT